MHDCKSFKIEEKSASERIREAYNEVLRAQSLFEDAPKEKKELLKLYYKTQIDIYRDICTEVVEKLMQIKPEVLNLINL